MASASSGRRAQSVTSLPASTSTFAKTVPQLPAPSTAARVTEPTSAGHGGGERSLLLSCSVTGLPLGRANPVVEVTRRGRKTAQVGDVGPKPAHDRVGHLTQHLGVRLAVTEGAQVDRRA